MHRFATIAIAALALALPHQTADAEGNIDVTIQGSILVINGDRLGNDILLRALPDGFLMVGGCHTTHYQLFTPYFWLDSGTTTVNGGDEIILLTPEQTNGLTDILVLGWAGDERILVYGDFSEMAGAPNLWIYGGYGQDLVLMNQYALLPGDLGIDTSLGDDTISISNLTVDGKTRIQTGQGDDWLGLYLDYIAHGDVTIDMGVHDDTVHIGPGEIDGNLTVALGPGNDLLLQFDLATTFVYGSATLDGGPGYDPSLDTSFIVADSLTIIGFESP